MTETGEVGETSEVSAEREVPAPIVPNEEQFDKLTPMERAAVIEPLIALANRYHRANGGWKLLADVLAEKEQTAELWRGATHRCAAAKDRRASQFSAIMSVVGDSIRAAVLNAIK